MASAVVVLWPRFFHALPVLLELNRWVEKRVVGQDVRAIGTAPTVAVAGAELDRGAAAVFPRFHFANSLDETMLARVGRGLLPFPVSHARVGGVALRFGVGLGLLTHQPDTFH